MLEPLKRPESCPFVQASARRRQQRAALRCCASEGEAAAGIESLQKHIKSAEGQARTIDGQQFIPLSSVGGNLGTAAPVACRRLSWVLGWDGMA